MKIRAIAPYFGGKRNLAGRIIALLGKHRNYWEPFCGSLAVLLSKPPCVMETANDLYGDVMNLAFVIRDEETAMKLYERLNRTLMAEMIFEQSADVLRQKRDCDAMGDLERAYHFFIASWLGRNGCAGSKAYNYKYCVRYTANGGHAATRWNSAIGSVPAWHKRLRNVTILNRDAFELFERIDDHPSTAIYVDPPYLKKGAKYIHDFDDGDHKRLATALSKFKKARIVVSYYDDPRLCDMYPGWFRNEITVTKALSNQGMRPKKNAKASKVIEVLLVNQSDTEGLFNNND